MVKQVVLHVMTDWKKCSVSSPGAALGGAVSPRGKRYSWISEHVPTDRDLDKITCVIYGGMAING